MGRPYQKRCANCRVLYSHWCGSTPYTNDPDNNGTHCPECHKAIRLALEAIPKKRRVKFVETDRFTCMDLDPDTVEPTDLPILEEHERTASPPTVQVGRVPRIFQLGSLESYRRDPGHTNSFKVGAEPDNSLLGLTPGELIKAESESLANLREIDDEAFLLSVDGGPFTLVNENYEEVKPVAVTTRKPDPNGPADRFMSDKSSGTHAPYAPLHLRREYTSVPRREFSNEPLPEGALPVYDKAPDIDPPAPWEGALLVERVEVSLIDMKDPWNKHKHGYVTRDGATFYYEWWTRTGKAAGKVSILMEENVATGDILGPWKDYR